MCFSPSVQLKANYPEHPRCMAYHSINNHFSDHQPVYALYNFQMPIEEEERKNHLNYILEQKFDEIQKLSLPSLNL
jgi:hypothetical protein